MLCIYAFLFSLLSSKQYVDVSRNKTITLERMKRSIVNEVRSGDQEGRCLAQYKREMELLQQEKMSHVEELRQIHADINAVSACSYYCYYNLKLSNPSLAKGNFCNILIVLVKLCCNLPVFILWLGNP